MHPEIHDIEGATDQCTPLEWTDAVQRRHEADILLGRQVLVQAEQLRHVRYSSTRSPAEFHGIFTQNANLARSAPERAGQHPDRGRLAGTTRPDHAQDGPRDDVQAEIVDRHSIVEGASDAAHGDDRLGDGLGGHAAAILQFMCRPTSKPLLNVSEAIGPKRTRSKDPSRAGPRR